MDADAASFANAAIDWHRRYGRRDLPWQGQGAYRVWLSEIMLQQTQVATVIPYYLAFVERFPDVRSLADAGIDEVLRYWQGLGYYARARNLHKAARIIRDRYDSRFPEDFDAVLALPGIGRSTAGAILSLARGQRWPILDGNVKRVLARCFRVPGWYAQGETMKQLWYLAESVTPADDTHEFNQAMMDIGAMVCLRSNPKCDACPLKSMCASYRHHSQADYPQRKPSRAKPRRQAAVMAAPAERHLGRAVVAARGGRGARDSTLAAEFPVDHSGAETGAEKRDSPPVHALQPRYLAGDYRDGTVAGDDLRRR